MSALFDPRYYDYNEHGRGWRMSAYVGVYVGVSRRMSAYVGVCRRMSAYVGVQVVFLQGFVMVICENILSMQVAPHPVAR